MILATGSLPMMPPIEGLDAIDGAWTNREATTTKTIPERLLIIGGGVVGVEMAQAFQTLGSQVTLIEGERRLLPHEEEFACAQVTEALERLRRRHPHRAEGRTRRAGRRRHRDRDDVRRRQRGRRHAARRARPRAVDQGPRARDRRARAGQDDQGRRLHARARPPVAVRDRRHQRPRPVHAHGQVPGAARRRPPARPRPRARPRRRRPAVAARDLHRAAGRGRRATRRRPPRRPA